MILLASQDLLRPVYCLEASGLVAPWPFHPSGILIFKKRLFTLSMILEIGCRWTKLVMYIPELI
ncbi:MAG: hypothetical protein QNL60_02875 [Flavobacteriales bacterium]